METEILQSISISLSVKKEIALFNLFLKVFVKIFILFFPL